MTNGGWVNDAPWVKSNHQCGYCVHVRRDDGGTHPVLFRSFQGGAGDLNGDPFYGSDETPGLAALYNTLDAGVAQNAANILDAGGAENLTSIWLLGWGDRTVCAASLDGTIPHPEGEWTIVVRDWRYIVRIANIDVKASTSLDAMDREYLQLLLTRATLSIPSYKNIRPIIYASQTIKPAIGETFRGIPIREMSAITENEDRVV